MAAICVSRTARTLVRHRRSTSELPTEVRCSPNHGRMENANPILAQGAAVKRPRRRDPLREVERSWGLAALADDETLGADDSDEADDEPINAAEIFDLIRSISDPEHPHTLEQLSVVSAPQIAVQHGRRPHVAIEFTPTIPHCSMATLIGLSIRVRLLRSLPDRFKVDIRVKEGSHQSENAVNKQLNDKERVAAALENTHLLSQVNLCLATADQRAAEEL